MCLIEIGWMYLAVQNCVNTLHFKIFNISEDASWMSNHVLLKNHPIKFYCWFFAGLHPLHYDCQELFYSEHIDHTLHVDDKINSIPEEYSEIQNIATYLYV